MENKENNLRIFNAIITFDDGENGPKEETVSIPALNKMDAFQKGLGIAENRSFPDTSCVDCEIVDVENETEYSFEYTIKEFIEIYKEYYEWAGYAYKFDFTEEELDQVVRKFVTFGEAGYEDADSLSILRMINSDLMKMKKVEESTSENLPF